MKRVALITGANGFVGGILSAHLARNGWSVREGALPGAPPAPNRLCCDIADPEQVRELVAWAAPITHVFHLAAVTFVPVSSVDPAYTMTVNVQGTVHLTSAVRIEAPEARFLYVGSAAAYGAPATLPVTEAHPFAPEEPYGISKAAADAYCAYLFRAHAMDVIRLRPFNHSGPGQSDRFVLSDFAHQIARIEAGQAPPVIHVGNLEASRDFLHVDDVVRAYELAALEGAPGEAYNVCSGRSYPIRSALELLLSLSGAAIRVETDPDRLRPVDIPEITGSHEKLTACTEWRPERRFETLIEDLLEFWRTAA